MSGFIGRQNELKLLEGLTLKNSSSLVVIYGRRRIGKSRLIAEFAKKYRYISFSGLFPDGKTTNQDQLDEFRTRFIDQVGKDPGNLSDWSEAFQALAAEFKDGRVVILFDEITWMGEQDVNFLGKLKNAWDLEFKNNNQLILILCGSVSWWIEKKLIASRGFYGRISLKMRLKELPLSDCDCFWRLAGGVTSSYEKFKLLSVTGGIPKYLEEIRTDLSSEENIRKLCFSRNGLLFDDYDYIFLSLLERNSPYYEKIINVLSNVSCERNDLLSRVDLADNGLLSNYLEELTVSGFLTRDFTWHLNSEKPSKLSKYRLSDNYLRFYIKYIRPNVARISSDRFENRSLSALPGWASMMGFQVENLILNNMNQLHHLMGIYPDEILNEGPFFQRKTARQAGCQIDYLVQLKYGVIYLCEIKFAFKGVRSIVINEVEEKIKRLSLPKNVSVKPVLIHVGDVYDEVLTSQYFSKIIDASELFNKG